MLLACYLYHLLTNRAQIFADVRSYWSPESIERVSGWKPDGILKDGAIILSIQVPVRWMGLVNKPMRTGIR